jgi:hypothetical protein
MKKNIYIQTIKVDKQREGRIGMLIYTDNDGKLYVEWEDGSIGVIRERGDTYRIIEKNIPQKISWNIKNLFVVLLDNIKQLFYGK